MTKKKNSEDFIQDAFKNICADRQKLEELYNEVSRIAKTIDDVLGLSAVSENLVKITDSLTKQTGQVVELAKLKQKSELAVVSDSDENISEEDKDNIYKSFEDDELTTN